MDIEQPKYFLSLSHTFKMTQPNYISPHFQKIHYPSSSIRDFRAAEGLGGGQVGEPVKLVNVTKTEYMYKYNGKEFQDELGLNLYDYGFRNYDPALGRWMNIDPLADANPNWTPYRYAFNNPLIFIDPTGMLEDIYVNENGDYLGADGASTKDVRVVSQETWDSVGGEKGAQTAGGTETLQKAENSQLLVGTDKMTQPGYQKGINISDKTWDKIEKAGGERAEPTVINDSGESVFIKPEHEVKVGPGAVGENENVKVKSGQSVYGMVDGVKTGLYSDAVYKLVDGNKVTVNSGGSISVNSYGGYKGFFGLQLTGGWSTSEFPTLRSAPIGRMKLPQPVYKWDPGKR